VVPTFFDWHEQPEPWPDSPRGRTRREIMARSKGLPIFRGWGVARAGLGFEEALEQARQLPPPTFDADRRLRDLDQLERHSEDTPTTGPRRPSRRRPPRRR